MILYKRRQYRETAKYCAFVATSLLMLAPSGEIIVIIFLTNNYNIYILYKTVSEHLSLCDVQSDAYGHLEMFITGKSRLFLSPCNI